MQVQRIFPVGASGVRKVGLNIDGEKLLPRSIKTLTESPIKSSESKVRSDRLNDDCSCIGWGCGGAA